MALTDLAIRNFKPQSDDKKLSDDGGLYLLVTRNGRKYWRYNYRILGVSKTMALGVYPQVSLKEAREKHAEAHKLVDQDIDPMEIRKSQKAAQIRKQANNFEAIAREWWSIHMKDKAESHKDKVIRRFELYLFPYIGSRPIEDITAPMLLETLNRIVKLNKLETAQRALQTAGQVWRYAIQAGITQQDITLSLQGALPTAPTKHMASFTDPDDVAELLRAIQGFKGTIPVYCALRLAPLVFVRPNELRQAKWADIDFEAAEWRYFVSKTKTDHVVPLSTQAISILKEMYPVSGTREYVFPGGRSPLKPMSEAAINAALQRMGYDTQTQITGHGFRAMARTILHERLGVDPNIIEHQLAHQVPDSLGAAYNRTKFLDQRKVMMQTWADYLDNLKN